MKVFDPRGHDPAAREKLHADQYLSLNHPRDGLYSGGMVWSMKNPRPHGVDGLFWEGGAAGLITHSFESEPM